MFDISMLQQFELVHNLKRINNNLFSFQLENNLTQILFVILVVVIGCAKIQAPPGGSVDAQGVRPILIKPSPDQIEVNTNTTIEITFDTRYKSVDPNLISLSPFPKAGLKILAKGKKISIIPQEPLLSDQTYHMTISPEIRDEQNNPMSEPIELLFSTGNEITRGTIKGIVYDVKNRRGIWIWAWKLPEKITADLEFPSPWNDPPEYVSVTDSSGRFQFYGLPDGRFRLLAIDDVNRSRKYETASDRIGISFDDPVVPKDSNTIFSFQLAQRDTALPAIQSIRMAAPRIVTFRLTAPILGKLGTNPLVISTHSDKWLGVPYHDVSDSNRMYCVFPKSFDEDSVQLEIKDFTNWEGRDFKVSIQTPRFSTKFIAEDTLKPTLVKLSPQGGSIFPSNVWTVAMSIGLAPGMLQNSLRMLQVKDSVSIPYILQPISPFVAKILPAQPLMERSEIMLEFKTNEWKSLTNVVAKDTLLRYRFSVVPLDTLGTITLEIEDNWRNKAGNLIISAVSLQIPNQANNWVITHEDYSEKVQSEGFVNLKVPAGLWRIRAFRDVNGNNQLDLGRVSPFIHSEPLVISKDSVRVRSRWTTVTKPLTLR